MSSYLHSSAITPRTVRSVTDCTQDSTNAEVTTAMDIGLIERTHFLDGSCKAGVIFLRQHVLDQGRVGESVHDPGIEVSSKAVSLGKVEHELRWDKGSSLHTSTPGAACDV
jgi:hypothetical protein